MGAAYLAVEVPGLTEEAVLLVRAVGAAVLVVAAIGSRVTGAVSGTGELVLLTGRTVLLVPSVGAVPVPVTALLLRVTAPVPPTGNLPRQAEPVHLRKNGTSVFSLKTPACRSHGNSGNSVLEKLHS